MRHVRPSVPEELEHAVTLALAPVAADRFASAAEFARALRPTVATPTPMPTATLVPAAGPSSSSWPPTTDAGGGDRSDPRVPHRPRRTVRLAAESSP